MGLKKRAPIDTRDEHGNLYQRRFRYCGDVETYWGSKGEEFLREKWVARNNTFYDRNIQTTQHPTPDCWKTLCV